MGWPKGRKRSQADREAISAGLKGQQVTWGHKISAAKKGVATSIQKGDKRSKEVRDKIKAGFTPEGRERIRAANIGKTLSDDHRQIISSLMKKDGRSHFMGGEV